MMVSVPVSRQIAAVAAEKKGGRLTLLFVCKANFHRSPAIEAVFRAAIRRADLADRVSAASAGVWVSDPSRWLVTNPELALALHEAGLTSELTSPKPLTKASLLAADLIFASDRVVKEEVDLRLRRLKRADVAGGDRCQLFTALAPDRFDGADLPDPQCGETNAAGLVEDVRFVVDGSLIPLLTQALKDADNQR